MLEELLANPNERLADLPNFRKNLLEGRFVLEDSENELAYVYKKNADEVNRLNYKLTILPTFSCNFNCWYCVQHHKRSFMTEQVVEQVKKHIFYKIKEQEIQSLNIEWFGGEPLLGFEKVIIPITSYAKQVCEEYNLPFSSGATTNGYLFTRNMLEKMKSLNMTGFQITLDGMREFHDKIRVAPNRSSFDEILKRINLICEILEYANVMIRINYDNENLDPDLFLDQIEERLNPSYKSRVSFLLRKVWQVKLSDQNKIKNLCFVQEATRRGFQVSPQTYLNTSYIRCYACRKNYNTIAPNGDVYKCTACEEYSGEKALGRLNSKGKIDWLIPGFEEKYFGYRPFENEQCKVCKYLPLCWGECPRSFEEAQLRSKAFRCSMSRQNDMSFEESILEYCISNSKK
ncbi:MAG: radical SAM protein [Parabacteroides sp.]|nr:radical SAM protein [Parabacteroides sp.]